jgi:hypothetical protein
MPRCRVMMSPGWTISSAGQGMQQESQVSFGRRASASQRGKKGLAGELLDAESLSDRATVVLGRTGALLVGEQDRRGREGPSERARGRRWCRAKEREHGDRRRRRCERSSWSGDSGASEARGRLSARPLPARQRQQHGSVQRHVVAAAHRCKPRAKVASSISCSQQPEGRYH